MERVGAGSLRCHQDGVHVEIARAGRSGADTDRLVCRPGVQGVGIGVGINGDGADAEPPAGAHDAECNLAAIGDQDRADRTGGVQEAQGDTSYIR